MDKFIKHTGTAVAIYQPNIDTDQIVPKKFLLSVERKGFGKALFYDWRYHPDGTPRSDFVLNEDKHRTASILLTGANFGCGSSREHAPWALAEYGFRVIIAPAFADIFYNNCFKIGLLPVVLEEARVSDLVANWQAQPAHQLTIDLEKKTVFDNKSFREDFVIDEFRRHSLLNGFDEIARTFQHEEKINFFEKNSPSFFNQS